jgi:hypothetical protein
MTSFEEQVPPEDMNQREESDVDLESLPIYVLQRSFSKNDIKKKEAQKNDIDQQLRNKNDIKKKEAQKNDIDQQLRALHDRSVEVKELVKGLRNFFDKNGKELLSLYIGETKLAIEEIEGQMKKSSIFAPLVALVLVILASLIFQASSSTSQTSNTSPSGTSQISNTSPSEDNLILLLAASLVGFSPLANTLRPCLEYLFYRDQSFRIRNLKIFLYVFEQVESLPSIATEDAASELSKDASQTN